jgi:septal ring factor EnvC (AmiA/AmiB activator)
MRRNILIALILVFCSTLNGQNILDLEKQKSETEKQIELTKELIQDARKKQKSSLSQLKLIQKSISLQQSLITSLNSEIALIENRIDSLEKVTLGLKNEITTLKREYERIIYEAYKNSHHDDKWLFIFSAKDFNQAYRRFIYLKQYAEYRTRQIELIEAKEKELRASADKLNDKLKEKDLLVKTKAVELSELQLKEEAEQTMFSALKSKEKTLKKELKRKREVAENIASTINKIIEEERLKNKELADKSIEFRLTPEEKIISDRFESNKGMLPWPTERGVVTSDFGEGYHPVLKGIKVFNSGIDISTVKGSSVRVLFNGEVRDVWSIKGRNMAVIIKHGAYFSVYQNLVDVKVKPGDMVQTKDDIGTIFTDDSGDNQTVLHLEVWKGSKRLDPKDWLARGE